MNEKHENLSTNFIETSVEKDITNHLFSRPIRTRFPPEPNGYLHIGNAYAINISYTIAKKYQGEFNLRLDDTNPLKESNEYVKAIFEDMEWLGFSPENRIFYGSDYSEQIYEYAIQLIKKGKAYVCELSPEQTRQMRGTLTKVGENSPYRNRSIEENLLLFTQMKNGNFSASTKVLRAKIDMSSAVINMRDPVMYRIIHAKHYRTGTDWCIYPMYDFAHPIQDAMEGITHSLCSIEFKDHRPLYEWFLKELELFEPPRQLEFGRLHVSGVVTSKRYLKELVEGQFVDGWDDPRLPTIRGLRRRGYTAESIKMFLGEIGIARNQTLVDISMLEHCIRADLKSKVHSVMAILEPLKVVITNYPEGETESLSLENNFSHPQFGKRSVPFSRELFIEKEDFMEMPIKGYHRLTLHGEVRLMGAYYQMRGCH